MKNILVIQGGGRPRGNTSQLVERFCAGARDAGHAVEVVSLVKNAGQRLLGCNACRYGKPCVQRDAFNDIAPKVLAADLLVLASPLYYWTLPARMKAFIERFILPGTARPQPAARPIREVRRARLRPAHDRRGRLLLDV